eukprot:747759-Hanusia_phi.AAC.1
MSPSDPRTSMVHGPKTQQPSSGALPCYPVKPCHLVPLQPSLSRPGSDAYSEPASVNFGLLRPVQPLQAPSGPTLGTVRGADPPQVTPKVAWLGGVNRSTGPRGAVSPAQVPRGARYPPRSDGLPWSNATFRMTPMAR